MARIGLGSDESCILTKIYAHVLHPAPKLKQPDLAGPVPDNKLELLMVGWLTTFNIQIIATSVSIEYF